MRSRSRWGSLVLCLLIGMPGLAADKKDADKKDPDKKDADKAAEKMVTGGEISGVLKSEGGSQKYITLSVTISYMQPNPAAAAASMQQQRQMMQYQQQLMQARNWQQRQQIYAQMATSMRQGQQNPFTVQTMSRDIDFQAGDDMKVRCMFPPPAFDEKGNFKKYTAKELKELKGDSNLPGYEAGMDALKPGQTVKVYLAKATAAKQPKAAAAPKEKAKAKEKEKDKDALDDDKPAIKLIVIIAEPANQG